MTTPRSGPTVLTFALEDWPRKDGPSTRASKPKVRTGCVTCKRRRIKCDETKPTCQNCVKRGISCEGYVAAPRTKAPPKHQRARTYRDGGSVSPLCIKPKYESLVFATQLQKDHFDHWLVFAKDALLFPSQLITETIPQLALTDAAVRNAAFAIGAASLGSSTREQRLRGGGPYYADALKYYNRALQLTATSPTTEEAIPRVLTSCLLFFMFEALQGNRRQALIHLNHGCRVLDDYVRRFGRKSTPLVDAIIANSQRLTMQSWSHNGDHPEETEDEVPWCCRGRSKRYAVDEMPDEFDSVDEAHRWWEITQHFVIRHAPLIIGFRVEGTGSKAPATYPPNQSLPIPADPVKGHIRYIERWRGGFSRLLEAERRSGRQRSVSSQEVRKVLGLRIHSTYLTVPVRTANYTDTPTLASCSEAFREVVTLSRKFLKTYDGHAKTGEVFTMDSNGPTWALGAAAMLCADEAVRADATKLLRQFPRRDGLWDTRTYVTMLEGVEEAKRAIASRLGKEDRSEKHMFSYEVVYDDKSISWVKAVEDPAGAVEPDAREYKIELP